VLYVTHDQTEALTLGRRIAILRDGRLIAQGPSRDLYRYPPNRFAAEFLGRANLLPVEVEGLEADGRLARVRFNGALLRAEVRVAPRPGTRCLLCVRPHDLALRPPAGAVNTLDGLVQTALWQGDQLSIGMEVDGIPVRVASLPLAEPPQAGELLRVHFPAERASLIVDDGD
jgi:2-aminoethylphosphonate transport system ATP-binding protein